MVTTDFAVGEVPAESQAIQVVEGLGRLVGGQPKKHSSLVKARQQRLDTWSKLEPTPGFATLHRRLRKQPLGLTGAQPVSPAEPPEYGRVRIRGVGLDGPGVRRLEGRFARVHTDGEQRADQVRIDQGLVEHLGINRAADVEEDSAHAHRGE